MNDLLGARFKVLAHTYPHLFKVAEGVRVVDADDKTRSFASRDVAEAWVRSLRAVPCVWGVFARGVSLKRPSDTRAEAEAEVRDLRSGKRRRGDLWMVTDPHDSGWSLAFRSEAAADGWLASLSVAPTTWDVVNRSGRNVSYYATDYRTEAEARSALARFRVVGAKTPHGHTSV